MSQEIYARGRTARHIAIIGVAVILLVLLVGGFIYMFMKMSSFFSSEYSLTALLIALLTVIIALISIVYSAIGLIIANDNIFPFSGHPVEMTHLLYQSFFLQSQTLLAILIIGTVLILLTLKIVTTSEGLPIITGAAGFALGKSFGEKGRSIQESKPEEKP